MRYTCGAGVRCAKAMAAVAALIVIAATCEQAVPRLKTFGSLVVKRIHALIASNSESHVMQPSLSGMYLSRPRDMQMEAISVASLRIISLVYFILAFKNHKTALLLWVQGDYRFWA